MAAMGADVPEHRCGREIAADAPDPGQRGRWQRVQVHGRQVSRQCVQVSDGLGLEDLVQPLVELLGVEPADSMMLAQLVSGPLAVLVRGPDRRVRWHRHILLAPLGRTAPPLYSLPLGGAMPAVPAMRATSWPSRAKPLAPPSSAV